MAVASDGLAPEPNTLSAPARTPTEASLTFDLLETYRSRTSLSSHGGGSEAGASRPASRATERTSESRPRTSGGRPRTSGGRPRTPGSRPQTPESRPRTASVASGGSRPATGHRPATSSGPGRPVDYRPWTGSSGRRVQNRPSTPTEIRLVARAVATEKESGKTRPVSLPITDNRRTTRKTYSELPPVNASASKMRVLGSHTPRVGSHTPRGNTPMTGETMLRDEISAAMKFFDCSEEEGDETLTPANVRDAFLRLGMKLSRSDMEALFPKGKDSWTRSSLQTLLQNCDWFNEFDPVLAALRLYEARPPTAETEDERVPLAPRLHVLDLVGVMQRRWAWEVSQFDVDIMLEAIGARQGVHHVPLKVYRRIPQTLAERASQAEAEHAESEAAQSEAGEDFEFHFPQRE
jgi:hypothetical protein